jgi:acyl-CoA synthetase (AMP-forming)/AMP-acid ligase II
MTSIPELLLRRSTTDRLAIIEGATGEGVAWREVAELAEKWRDARVSGPVGLAISDPVAMAANFVAAIAAGVVVAPLDPNSPPPEMAARIDQLRLRSVLISPGSDLAVGLRSSSGAGTERWVAGRRALVPAGGTAPGRPALPAEPGRVGAIMASSGTTGVPKIIPLTENQLLATANSVVDHLQLGPLDRGYSPLPLFHINALVVGVLSALQSGGSVAVDRRFSRRAFWSTVRSVKANWLNLVPAILAVLADEQADSCAGPAASCGVRLARSASAPLPISVKERFERMTGIPVVETYGMTEAASQITANPLGSVRPGSVGRPYGIEVEVVDKAGRRCPPNELGQVRIRGDRVASFYWIAGTEWSSRRAIDEEGWLDTGDVGWNDAAGYLHLLGRDGDVINRGGEKIHPREVEEVLLSDPRVMAAVVVGRPHPTYGEEPVAYVLPAPGAVIGPEELARLCASALSRYKRPAEVVVATSLPAGPTGKFRRSEIRAMASASKERN